MACSRSSISPVFSNRARNEYPKLSSHSGSSGALGHGVQALDHSAYETVLNAPVTRAGFAHDDDKGCELIRSTRGGWWGVVWCSTKYAGDVHNKDVWRGAYDTHVG